MLTFYILLTLGLQAVTCYRCNVKKPPNIVIIMSDDQGWNDVSWNNPEVITPNLQSLASNGVVMNQSYVQSVCSPSRAAYMTGLYPYHIGFQGGLIRHGPVEYLPLNLTLLPEKLKRLGYDTNLVGKWHIGHCRKEATPTFRGFNYFFGCYSGTIEYYTKTRPPVQGNVFNTSAYDLRENLDIYRSPPSEYLTDLFTQKAVDVINNHDKSNPLFLSLHYTAPHLPLQVPEEYLSLYPNVSDPARKTYLAMVTKMDEGVGKVVAALKGKGMFEDTIIVFTSDYVPHRGLVSHIAVCRWGLIASLISVKNLDGINQWPMLSRGIKGRRNLFVYNIADDYLGNGPIYAIRVGNYKLIEGNATSAQGNGSISIPTRQPNEICDCELYNLHDDPTESNDLTAQQPGTLATLYATLKKLKKSLVPPIIVMTSPIVPEANPLNFNNTISYGWC